MEIVLAELHDVLSVPIAAVFSDQDQTFCFRVDAEGKPRRVPVKVGHTSETRAQILSGLKEGDMVLLAPPPGEDVGGKLVGRRQKRQEEAAAGTSRRPGPTTRAAGGHGPTTRPAKDFGKPSRVRPAGSSGRSRGRGRQDRGARRAYTGRSR